MCIRDRGRPPADAEDKELASLVGKLGGKEKLKKLLLMLLED